MKKAEQLPRYRPLWWWQTYGWPSRRGRRERSSASRVWCKRLVNRQRRRAEKRDPENVPTKFTRGWYD